MQSSIIPTKLLRDTQTSGFILTEFAQPPLLKTPKHFHDCATMLITLKGFAADRIAGQTQECNPLGVLIRPPGEWHTHDYGRTGLRGLVIEFKPEKLKAIHAFSKILDSVGNYRDKSISELALRLYTESKIFDSASELAIEGLLLEIIARATRLTIRNRNFGAPPRWLKDALEFIHENYAQPTSLSRIAAMAGVHQAHLAEIFRKHYGCSIGEYIRRLRIDYATRELMLSEKSVAEIAAAAGFYDQSHFTKFFKRYTGTAPAEMRAVAGISKAHTKSLRSSKTG